jgi:hypothetical protein
MSFQLEEKQIFSLSVLWDLQRKYFEEKGFEAWRQGEVPHYVTTNPRIANSYAEMVFALYTDTVSEGGIPEGEPYYILEIGGGSGRFAYYLFSRLLWLCDQSGLPHNTFRFVLSDFTQSNANFWRTHPCFQTFFTEGLMDIAIFDATQKQDIHLQLSGITLQPGKLMRPLTVVANYLFDSIPQELFYCKNQQVRPCLVSLSVKEDPAQKTAGELLEQLLISYNYGDASLDYYQEAYLQDILTFYRQYFDDAYIFFPVSGIECIKHLSSLSQKGMMLLTADKGEHLLERTSYDAAPGLVKHGSFSLTVNYHALRMYCEASAGISMFPEHVHGSINTGCLLFMPDALKQRSVAIAYRKFVAESGPDDYYTVYRFLQENIEAMPFKTILSSIRMSLFDSYQLSYYMPRLMVLATEITIDDKIDLVNLINKCWENYYPLGEQADLANRIALLMYEIDVYDWALHYFRLSAGIYGNDTGTLFNMAACYEQLSELDNCTALLKKILQHDPANNAALQMLQKYEAQPPPGLVPQA